MGVLLNVLLAGSLAKGYQETGCLQESRVMLVFMVVENPRTEKGERQQMTVGNLRFFKTLKTLKKMCLQL